MTNILLYILIALFIVLGLGSTILVILGLIYTIAQKLYKKIRFGNSFFD